MILAFHITLSLDLENITTFVLDIFTCSFQVWQYKYIAFNEACSSAADSAKITVSSAYSNKYKRKYTATSSVKGWMTTHYLNM
jgi:hypothetical protein